jgi:hypothetical protein
MAFDTYEHVSRWWVCLEDQVFRVIRNFSAYLSLYTVPYSINSQFFKFRNWNIRTSICSTEMYRFPGPFVQSCVVRQGFCRCPLVSYRIYNCSVSIIIFQDPRRKRWIEVSLCICHSYGHYEPFCLTYITMFRRLVLAPSSGGTFLGRIGTACLLRHQQQHQEGLWTPATTWVRFIKPTQTYVDFICSD